MKYQKLTIKKTDNDPTEIDEDRLVDVCGHGHFEIDGEIDQIERRNNGVFKKKALYLQNRFEWVLGEDEYGSAILIPLKKK